MCRLVGMGANFAPPPGELLRTDPTGTVKKMFDVLVLVRCLLLSNMVRNSASLQKVVKRAVELALPAHAWKAVEHLSMGGHLPSDAVMSRFKVIMDAGLMMAMCDVHKSRNDAGVLRAFLSDFSARHTELAACGILGNRISSGSFRLRGRDGRPHGHSILSTTSALS